MMMVMMQDRGLISHARKLGEGPRGVNPNPAGFGGYVPCQTSQWAGGWECGFRIVHRVPPTAGLN